MKKLFKGIIEQLVKSTLGWKLCQILFVLPGEHAAWARKMYMRRADVRSTVAKHFSNWTVKHGPFAGMRMASFDGPCLAQLLGSYERELHPVIERCCETGYSQIIDIGSSIGYYAVGMAMRNPKVQVCAYDIDEDALSLCRQSAELNGVSDRVTYGSFCDSAALLDIEVGQRALVICDCEGYEKILFDESTVARLTRHDLLIEVHDQIEPGVGEYLKTVLEPHYDIQVMDSISDEQKVQEYDYPELTGLSDDEKLSILLEGRGATMQWFYCTLKRTQ